MQGSWNNKCLITSIVKAQMAFVLKHTIDFRFFLPKPLMLPQQNSSYKFTLLVIFSWFECHNWNELLWLIQGKQQLKLQLML